jgi:hypothetical protein
VNWCGASGRFLNGKRWVGHALRLNWKHLIVRLAKENPRWGSSKIEGELLKLGYHVGRSTIRAVLKRQHIPGAPIRARQSSTWRSFLRQHQYQLLACDFFTVETLRLQTLYVLFFLELGTRRIHVAACTVHPTAAWVMRTATSARMEAPRRWEKDAISPPRS